MKRVLVAGLVLAGSVLAAPVNAADLDLSNCSIPKLPTLPDGGKATQDEMVAASGAVKAYLAENDATLKCLESARASVGDEALSEEQSANYTTLYNGVVDAAHQVGEGWNAAVRAFKAQ
jgi:predicted lipoprotein